MTLLLELSDSQSGEALVRVADRKQVGKPSAYRSNSISNWGEVRLMFKHWAVLLRQRLDSVPELPELPGEEPLTEIN